MERPRPAHGVVELAPLGDRPALSPLPLGRAPRPAPTPDGNAAPRRPTRFFGAVELDPDRPITSFETILKEVVHQIERTPGARRRLVLEIEAEAPEGFADEDVGVIRDNARQLRFRSDSTGFD